MVMNMKMNYWKLILPIICTIKPLYSFSTEKAISLAVNSITRQKTNHHRSHLGSGGTRNMTTKYESAMDSLSMKNDLSEDPPSLLVSLREKLERVDLKEENTVAKLVLASQSPRRREILDMMGLSNRYMVEPSPLDESQLQLELVQQNLLSKEYTCRLAEAKARALAVSHVNDNDNDTEAMNGESNTVTFYLGSDTIVELDEKILEKPKDDIDAKRMLRLLSGRQHHVHTAVALYKLQNKQVSLVASFVDTATVTFSKLGEKDIDAYVASGEPMDKAGSYGIQGIGGQFVTEITGDFFTVMGLPMHRTSKLISQALTDWIVVD